MWGIRLLLVIMLAAVGDVSHPVLPEAGEAFEEFQESAQDEMAHGRSRLSVLVHGLSLPSTPALFTPVIVAAPRPRSPRPAVRTRSAVVRRIAPPLPDSAPDSH